MPVNADSDIPLPAGPEDCADMRLGTRANTIASSSSKDQSCYKSSSTASSAFLAASKHSYAVSPREQSAVTAYNLELRINAARSIDCQ